MEAGLWIAVLMLLIAHACLARKLSRIEQMLKAEVPAQDAFQKGFEAAIESERHRIEEARRLRHEEALAQLRAMRTRLGS